MCQELVNVRLARYFYVPIGLMDIDAVECIQDALIAKVNAIFGTDSMNKVLDSVEIRASNSKIFNLSANEHAVSFVVCTLIEAALMRR
jgi:hypothetical protein